VTRRLEKAALPRPFEAQDELKFGGFHLEKMARWTRRYDGTMRGAAGAACCAATKARCGPVKAFGTQTARLRPGRALPLSGWTEATPLQRHGPGV